MSELNSVINVNVNSEVKKEATEIFNSLGLNMSTAINMFLMQVIKTDGIPFEVVNHKPNRKLRKALKEAEAICSGKKKAKKYDNFEEALKDILD